MNIYLLSQNVNNNYNTYNSCVVIAQDKKQAKWFHPDGSVLKEDNLEPRCYLAWTPIKNWCHPEKVKIKFIGIADESLKPGVICASYNAG